MSAETNRHDAHCEAMAAGFDDWPSAIIIAVKMRRQLLAHFDEHEPAVADAIRYGLRETSTGELASTFYGGKHVEGNVPKGYYRIDYPEDHTKADPS